MDIKELAQRIFDVDPFGNGEATTETIATDLMDLDICHSIIEYLLDTIDDMEARAN